MTQLQFESNVRKTLDFVIAILVGVLTELFWGWKMLLIIVGIYSFLKANFLYNKLRNLPPESYMSEKQIIDTLNTEDPVIREAGRKGYREGYTTMQWVIQLLLTFTVVGVLSSIIKLLLGWTMPSTLWLTLFIVFGCLTIYMTLKRIWTS